MKKIGLIFDFYNLKGGGNFRFGKLILATTDKNLRFHATSGLLNFQDISSCGTSNRGAIPPCELVGISEYTVSTNPIFMPEKRGIEGNFYRILPYSNRVQVNDRISARGDFGIHADMGIKGTAGCVGLTRGKHWEVYQREMKFLFDEGIDWLPLFVPVGY